MRRKEEVRWSEWCGKKGGSTMYFLNVNLIGLVWGQRQSIHSFSYVRCSMLKQLPTNSLPCNTHGFLLLRVSTDVYPDNLPVIQDTYCNAMNLIRGAVTFLIVAV